MKTVWALLVVSSEAQSETLRHQRAWAVAVAKDKGWRVGRFIEGVASGNDGPRKLSRDLLLEVRAAPVEARPSYILMIRLDRVGRGSIVDSQIFVRDLLALGTRVFTRDAGEIKLDSAMDELVAAVQMAVARHENDVRRDKMRAVYKRRRDAGEVLSNRAPYGLFLELKPKRRLIALPSHRALLKSIFEKRVAGERVVDIARWLQDKAPPYEYKNGTRPHVHWTDTRLARLICNRAYAGTAVTESLWLRAQRVSSYAGRAPRRVRKHGQFLLGGMIRCACGRALSSHARNCIRNAKRGVPPARYYVCQAMWNHEKRWITHNADAVELTFERLLRRLARSPGSYVQRQALAHWGVTQRKVEKSLADLRAKLEGIRRQRMRAWRHDDAGLLDPVDFAERLRVLKEREDSVLLHIAQNVEDGKLLAASAQRDDYVEALFRDAWARYVEANHQERISIARAVISAVGGLRVAGDGRLVTGTGQDCTPQKRLTTSERVRQQALAQPRSGGRFVSSDRLDK